MSLFVFKNNASSLLASGAAPTDTTITVSAGQGALFPSISAGQKAAIAVEDVSGDIEIMYCTGRTGDVLTVVRGQEGTTAISFASGSRVENRITATTLATFLQKTGGDVLSGTTTVSGVIDLGAGGSIQAAGGEMAGVAIRAQPGDTSNQILLPIGGPATEGGSVLLTKGNIAANLPAGSALAVTNMIVFWAGLSSAIPSGWHLCDGTSGTPDLRDKFIVGGGGSLATTGSYAHVTDPASSGAITVGSHVLSVAELPAHEHPFDYGFNNTSGSDVIGVPGFTMPSQYIFAGVGTAFRHSFAGTPTGGGGGHTHSGSSSGTHTHTVESPPYRAVFAIMKL